MCNGLATFQRMVAHFIQGVDGVYAYLDDIVVVSETWEEHVTKLEPLFGRLRSMGLNVDLAKSTFAKAQVKYLGHVIGSGQILPKSTNIETIQKYHKHKSRKK